MNKTNIYTRPLTLAIFAIICCMLWGSAYPGIKLGYEAFLIPQQDSSSQLLFAGIRFLLAGLLAVLFGSVKQKKLLLPKKSSFKYVVILCLVQTVAQYLFFYIGLANASAVKSSIINGSSSFISILIACFIFRAEKMTAKKLIACFLGFFAILLINIGAFTQGGGFSLMGEGFILFSTVSYAFSSCLVKIFSKDENAVALSAWQFVLGGIVLIAAGLMSGGKITQVTPAGIGILLYLALLSAIAYSLWSQLLKFNPVSKVAVFGFMIPVSGSLFSAIFLGETVELFDYKTLIALALITVGIILINRQKTLNWQEK